MTYEEAREYIKKMLGCANKTGGDGLCQDHCDGCRFDYEVDDWEAVMATVIEALEKQIPKKIIPETSPYKYDWKCPRCGDTPGAWSKYCERCGQRVTIYDDEVE